MSEEAGAVEASSEVSDSTEVTESASPEVTEVSEGSEVEPVEGEGVEVAPEEAPALYDIVIDGETQQVSLDDLRQGFQLKSASNKRFQEAAEARKQAEELESKTEEWKQKLLQNPYEALLNSGLPFESIRDHYENVVYQMLQMDQMSEEERGALTQQREYERQKQEYDQLKQQLAEREEAEKQQALQAEVVKQQEVWSNKIGQAIESGGLPVTPEAVRYVANTLKTAMETGYDLDVDAAVAIYKEETDSSIKGLLSKLPEDALMNLIGEERMNVIRKKDIERIKNPALSKEPLVDKLVPEEDGVAASSFFDTLRESTYKR